MFFILYNPKNPTSPFFGQKSLFFPFFSKVLGKSCSPVRFRALFYHLPGESKKAFLKVKWRGCKAKAQPSHSSVKNGFQRFLFVGIRCERYILICLIFVCPRTKGALFLARGRGIHPYQFFFFDWPRRS